MTILIVFSYGFLTGMSDSTKRAVIMITVFLLSHYFEKQTDSMNILSVSGLIILILFPFSLFSVSFIFSFTAVFFIILYDPMSLMRTWFDPGWGTLGQLLVFLVLILR